MAEVEKLIKDGDAISDALPTLNILKESAKKAKEWLTKSGELMKHPDHKQYIDVLETLVQRGRPLPVKLGKYQIEFLVASRSRRLLFLLSFSFFLLSFFRRRFF